MRNSGISWNLSTADFMGAVRTLWSKPESPQWSPGNLLPPLNLISQKPALAHTKWGKIKQKKKKEFKIIQV